METLKKLKRAAKAWLAFLGALLTAASTAIVTVPEDLVPNWLKVAIPVACVAVTWLVTYLTPNAVKPAPITEGNEPDPGEYSSEH